MYMENHLVNVKYRFAIMLFDMFYVYALCICSIYVIRIKGKSIQGNGRRKRRLNFSKPFPAHLCKVKLKLEPY